MVYRNRSILAAAVMALGGAAFAQTPGTNTSNPYPNVTSNLTVQIRDVVTVPLSSGAPARLNSAATAPDGRFFVVDQRGPIYNVVGNTQTAYLNVASLGLNLNTATGEQGLASLAFHPQFNAVGTPGYGKAYIALSTNAGGTPTFNSPAGTRSHDEVVYELTTTNPGAATFTASAAPRQVLRIAQPFSNHNGGGLGFNPNAVVGSNDYGALYYSMGDGGSGGDPLALGQNANSPFGKILRINPLGTNGTGGGYGIVPDNAFAADGNNNTLAEVYATGFRNPQRFSWDTAGSKKMYTGDVGQGVVEEVDVVVNGGNYGWGNREGSFVYVNTGTVQYPQNPDPFNYVRPIAEYDHGDGQAVSGGFVYRGTAIGALTGKYIFGDLVNGRLFYTDADAAVGSGNAGVSEFLLSENGGPARTLLQLIRDDFPSAGRADLRLGQNAAGEIYILNKQDGVVRVLVPEPGSMALLGGASLLSLRRRRR